MISVAEAKSQVKRALAEGLVPVISMARQSTDMQQSVADQHADNEFNAEEFGCVVVARFTDKGESRSKLDRPGLLEAREFLSSGGALGVILTQQDRVIGETYQIQPLLSEWRRLGVRLYNEKGELLYTTSEGRLEVTRQAMQSEEQLAKIRGNTARGLRSKARKGVYVGKPPFGLRMAPIAFAHNEHGTQVPVTQVIENGKIRRSGKVEVDPELLPWVVQIFEWCAERVSIKEICRRLDAAQVPTPGKSIYWQDYTVRYILRNEQYLGHWTWGKRETVHWAGEVTREPGKRQVRQPTGLGELVSRELFDRASRVLQERSQVYTSDQRRRLDVHLLEGFVFHADCGKRMQLKTFKTPRHRTPIYRYQCTPNHGTDRVVDEVVRPRCTKSYNINEKLVLAALAGVEYQGEPLRVTWSVQSDTEALEQTVRRLRRERSAQEEILPRLKAAFRAGHDTVKEYGEGKASVQAEISRIDQEIADVENALQRSSAPLSASDDLRALVGRAVETFASHDRVEEARQKLHQLVERILVSGGVREGTVRVTLVLRDPSE